MSLADLWQRVHGAVIPEVPPSGLQALHLVEDGFADGLNWVRDNPTFASSMATGVTGSLVLALYLTKWAKPSGTLTVFEELPATRPVSVFKPHASTLLYGMELEPESCAPNNHFGDIVENCEQAERQEREQAEALKAIQERAARETPTPTSSFNITKEAPVTVTVATAVYTIHTVTVNPTYIPTQSIHHQMAMNTPEEGYPFIYFVGIFIFGIVVIIAYMAIILSDLPSLPARMEKLEKSINEERRAKAQTASKIAALEQQNRSRMAGLEEEVRTLRTKLENGLVTEKEFAQKLEKAQESARRDSEDIWGKIRHLVDRVGDLDEHTGLTDKGARPWPQPDALISDIKDTLRGYLKELTLSYRKDVMSTVSSRFDALEVKFGALTAMGNQLVAAKGTLHTLQSQVAQLVSATPGQLVAAAPAQLVPASPARSELSDEELKARIQAFLKDLLPLSRIDNVETKFQALLDIINHEVPRFRESLEQHFAGYLDSRLEGLEICFKDDVQTLTDLTDKMAKRLTESADLIDKMDKRVQDSLEWQQICTLQVEESISALRHLESLLGVKDAPKSDPCKPKPGGGGGIKLGGFC